MKFKISARFWPAIQQYLDGLDSGQGRPINYQWHLGEDQEQGQLSIVSGAASIFNIQHMVVTRLYSEYQRARDRNSEITVGKWLEDYKKVFGPMKEEPVCGLLNQSLTAQEYHELKQRIAAKKTKLDQLVHRNRQLQRQYQEVSQIEDKKLQLGLQNAQLKLQQAQSTGEDTAGQLERISSLIKNGMWGLLPQVETKINVIYELEAELRELKQSSQ